jgi:hypothetical protein
VHEDDRRAPAKIAKHGSRDLSLTKIRMRWQGASESGAYGISGLMGGTLMIYDGRTVDASGAML